MEEKVAAVEEVFSTLQLEIEAFKQASGLGCLTGCGACCLKPDIQATVLEFLPFAYHLTLQNKAEEVFERLETGGSLCTVFQPLATFEGAGKCGEYAYRGLICRLFGFTASLNKEGRPVLSTCQRIKLGKKENYDKAVQLIEENYPVPVMRHYYMQLSAIDWELGSRTMPINVAIRKALEFVGFYLQFRNDRAG